MKPIAYLSAGLLGLALTLDAAAVPITRGVTLTSTDGLTTLGSFNVNFDDATPAGPCGAACTLSDIAITTLGHAWTASEVTSLSVVFDPATFISSWAVSFAFDNTVAQPGGLVTGNILTTSYTGNADHTLAIGGKNTLYFVSPGDCEPPRPGEPEPECPSVQGSQPRAFIGAGRWTSATPPTPEVPEPATAGLALAGLGFALAARRRRAKLRV